MKLLYLCCKPDVLRSLKGTSSCRPAHRGFGYSHKINRNKIKTIEMFDLKAYQTDCLHVKVLK